MVIFKKRIRLTHIIIALLSAIAIVQFVLLNQVKRSNRQDEELLFGNGAGKGQCTYEIGRTGGYRFINPLLDARQECESNKYQPVKEDIASVVQRYQQSGQLTSASVYLQDFKQNDWITYNGNEKYSPGSLLKVPLLIAYLRMAELQPGVLEARLTFDKHYNFDKNPVFLSKSIEFGKSYTVRELLRYTIAYSDNNANNVLFDHVNFPVLQKVFTDLGVTAPDWGAPIWPLTAADYSKFMDAIYNASYLSNEHSEFASELLSQCDFHDGIERSLPDSLLLIHKFAEAGSPTEKEFHESAIIYLHNSPYLLTIMTKGTDLAKLPKVVSELSKVVYDDMIRLSII